jgi:hypothetical protein
MPEPITLATVAALTEAGIAAGEEVAATLNAADVGGQLAALESVGLGAAGSSTEAFVGSLELDAAGLGEVVLSRAEASGAALSEALRKVGAELPQIAKSSVDAGGGKATFDAARWSEWSPQGVERVTPLSIAERFRPLRDPSNLESYVRNLEQRDAGFAKELSRRQEQLQSARSPAELDAALQQVRKCTAGKLGEAIATDGLKPYFNGLELQRRVETANGTTFIDGRFTDARRPIIFGRGHSVAEGGTLSVEVKTGQPGYLEREVSHIAGRQVQGHLAAGDTSLVLVSRDVYAMTGERAARDTVAEAGSRVMALLPEKRAMDEALLRLLRDRVDGA